MSEIRTAVTGTYEGVVDVIALPPCGMVTLRGDLADDGLRAGVRAVTGVEVPLVRRADFAGDRGALWMAHDELMLVVPQGQAGAAVAQMSEALGDSHGLAIDVSDARAVFQLKGAGLREVIAKLAPVDMAPDAFGPGDFRRTRFGQIAAAFWMDSDDSIRIVCFRSVADYMYTMLCHAAAPEARLSLF